MSSNEEAKLRFAESACNYVWSQPTRAVPGSGFRFPANQTGEGYAQQYAHGAGSHSFLHSGGVTPSNPAQGWGGQTRVAYPMSNFPGAWGSPQEFIRPSQTSPLEEQLRSAAWNGLGLRETRSDNLDFGSHHSAPSHSGDLRSHHSRWSSDPEIPVVKTPYPEKPPTPTSRPPSNSWHAEPPKPNSASSESRSSLRSPQRDPPFVDFGSPGARVISPVRLSSTEVVQLQQELARVQDDLERSLREKATLKHEGYTLRKQVAELEQEVARLKAAARPSTPEIVDKRVQDVNERKPQCCQRTRSSQPSSLDVFGEGPTLLVEISKEKSPTFRVHECGRRLLQALPAGKPIKVLSIVGEMRRGKSYIMNRILGVPHGRGFEIGHLNTACTKGLWVLPKQETNATILAVDAEGLYDPQQPNDDLDHAIFRCALLLSSFVIYNTGSPINSAAVAKLKFIAQLIDCMGAPGASASQEFDPRRLQRILPPLMFLTRDRALAWSPEVPDAQAEVDQNVLRLHDAAARDEADTRHLIRDMFPRVLGFSLPTPVDGDSKAIGDSPQLVKPEFTRLSGRLRDEVLGALQCKTIAGDGDRGEQPLTLDPLSFLSYAEQIVASSKNVPVMGDLFEAVSSNLKHKVNQEWRELYTRRMNEMESKFPVEAPDFGQASLAASSDAAKAAFEHHNLTAGLQGDVLLHCRDELPLLEGPYAAANADASQRLCESLYEDAVANIHARLRSEQYNSVQAFNADRLTAFQKYREHARGPYMPVLLQRFVMLDELQSLQERLHVPNDERTSQREELQQQLEDIDLYLELYQSSMSAETLRQQKADIEWIQAQLEESYQRDKAQADAELAAREAQFAQLLITMREESRQKLYEERQCWKENVEQQKEATEQQRAEDMAKLAEQARRKEEDLQAEKVRAKKMLRNERFKVMAKRLGMVAASSLISTGLSMLYNIPMILLQNL